MSSKRRQIVEALSAKINQELNGTIRDTNIYNNCYPVLKFWDQVNDFPSIYMSPGLETREYLPSAFAWGQLHVSIKAYTKGDTSQEELEALLADIERVVDNNRTLVYDSVNNYSTTEILITSILTDEGLLAPYAVGEINLSVKYQVM